MPSKQPPAAKKGQTNLFSFFNKPSTNSTAEATASIDSASDGDSTPCYGSIKKRVDDEKNPGSAATSKADDSPFSAMSSQRSLESHEDCNEIHLCMNDALFDKKRKLVVDREIDGRLSIVERGIINIGYLNFNHYFPLTICQLFINSIPSC